MNAPTHVTRPSDVRHQLPNEARPQIQVGEGFLGAGKQRLRGGTYTRSDSKGGQPVGQRIRRLKRLLRISIWAKMALKTVGARPAATAARVEAS